MNSRILTLLFCLSCTFHICAQDFDADSIYYTPIPKVKPVEETRRARPALVSGQQASDTVSSDRFLEYFFNVQVGALIGCSDCISEKEVSFTGSTVHGVMIGEKFRVGGGLGFDSYYNWQTMPVFGSASWDVLGTKNTNTFFIQVNYGWSAPWRTQKNWEYGATSVEGGQMFYGMAGLRIKYYDLRMALTLGGKFQTVKSIFESPTWYYDWNGNLIQGSSSRTTIEETLRRFAIAITIGWK